VRSVRGRGRPVVRRVVVRGWRVVDVVRVARAEARPGWRERGGRARAPPGGSRLRERDVEGREGLALCRCARRGAVQLVAAEEVGKDAHDGCAAARLRGEGRRDERRRGGEGERTQSHAAKQVLDEGVLKLCSCAPSCPVKHGGRGSDRRERPGSRRRRRRRRRSTWSLSLLAPHRGHQRASPTHSHTEHTGHRGAPSPRRRPCAPSSSRSPALARTRPPPPAPTPLRPRLALDRDRLPARPRPRPASPRPSPAAHPTSHRRPGLGLAPGQAPASQALVHRHRATAPRPPPLPRCRPPDLGQQPLQARREEAPTSTGNHLRYLAPRPSSTTPHCDARTAACTSRPTLAASRRPPHPGRPPRPPRRTRRRPHQPRPPAACSRSLTCVRHRPRGRVVTLRSPRRGARAAVARRGRREDPRVGHRGRPARVRRPPPRRRCERRQRRRGRRERRHGPLGERPGRRPRRRDCPGRVVRVEHAARRPVRPSPPCSPST